MPPRTALPARFWVAALPSQTWQPIPRYLSSTPKCRNDSDQSRSPPPSGRTPAVTASRPAQVPAPASSSAGSQEPSSKASSIFTNSKSFIPLSTRSSTFSTPSQQLSSKPQHKSFSRLPPSLSTSSLSHFPYNKTAANTAGSSPSFSPRLGTRLSRKDSIVDQLRSGQRASAANVMGQRDQARQRAQSRLTQGSARKANEVKNTEAAQNERASTVELMSMQPLRWVAGDCYSPHDLTPAEQRHYMYGRKGKVTRRDRIDETGINPLDSYRNFTLIDQWTSGAGRILHSDVTGYRPRNQRKMAKAVRRAVGLGLFPSTYSHPEQLARQLFPIDQGVRKP